MFQPADKLYGSITNCRRKTGERERERERERDDAGDIANKLKQAWNDDTRGIQLSPSKIIEKLIALIPPRPSPLLRYGGVFAPNFKRRDQIILRAGKRKRKVSIKHVEKPAAPPARAGIRMRTRSYVLIQKWETAS